MDSGIYSARSSIYAKSGGGGLVSAMAVATKHAWPLDRAALLGVGHSWRGRGWCAWWVGNGELEGHGGSFRVDGDDR